MWLLSTKSDFVICLWNDYYLISNLLLVHCFILYLIWSVSYSPPFDSYSQYVIGDFKRSDYSLWFWNSYYNISSSLIVPLFAYIYIFLIHIQIIIARMFFLQTVISLYDSKWLLSFIQRIDWYFYSLKSVRYFFHFNLL